MKCKTCSASIKNRAEWTSCTCLKKKVTCKACVRNMLNDADVVSVKSGGDVVKMFACPDCATPIKSMLISVIKITGKNAAGKTTAKWEPFSECEVLVEFDEDDTYDEEMDSDWAEDEDGCDSEDEPTPTSKAAIEELRAYIGAKPDPKKKKK